MGISLCNNSIEFLEVNLNALDPFGTLYELSPPPYMWGRRRGRIFFHHIWICLSLCPLDFHDIFLLIPITHLDFRVIVYYKSNIIKIKKIQCMLNCEMRVFQSNDFVLFLLTFIQTFSNNQLLYAICRGIFVRKHNVSA